MKKLLIFFFAAAIMVASCAQRQSSNKENDTDSIEDSMTTIVEREQSSILAYAPKYKSVKEALDACDADSFIINYYQIIIVITPDDCRVYPSIGNTTLEINPFPFVEYLVEDQNGNSPFVILKDIGRYPDEEIDEACFYIGKFKNDNVYSSRVSLLDTVEHYVQTFTPNFKKFHKLLENYETNYFIQKKYYEEHHKFIED